MSSEGTSRAGRSSGNKSGVSDQVLSLPSGGGAITGTGGNYMTDLQTGAANHSIPIDVPGGRNGMQPTLALSYSTGNSHGVAGMGWSLGTAAITRNTADGVPVYDDTADTFLLRGDAELVAVERRTEDDGTDVTRYRPRKESGFARITHRKGGTTDHWVVESKDGSVSYYGTPGGLGSDPAVVANPEDRSEVFAWYLTATEDEFGNRIEYDYRRDTGETDQHHWDGLYLDRIRYVDYETDDGTTEFLVTVAFEYEDRPDPNSTYNAGFEQRTRERLARIAIRTHADRDRTIRSYELTYRDELPDAELPANGTSQLARAEVVGHDDGETERMPAVEFEYSRFDPEERDFEALDGPIPRRSLAAPELELADLSGDGLPDIVEIDDSIRYWKNVGNGSYEPPREMEEAPAGLSLAESEVQLMDADGDGRIDLVSFAEPMAGYFPLERDGGWSRESFKGYDEVPNVDVDAPEVQLLDLDGNGVTDMVRTGNSLECFFQDSEEGWNEVRTVPDDALDGIDHIDLDDPRMRVGDLSGDGLQDIVMISDGHVSYWPNHGYGNWGKRIWMQNPPDLPRDHDPGRVLVGDVDGDGLADLAYVEDDRVRLWMNRCGNGWSDPIVVYGTPSVTDTDAIRLVDLTGTGIGGLLYSGGGRPGNDEMYYLDFVGGPKPYLMTETRNGMGSSTRIGYAPSTEFYLRDERDGDGWKTKLPQPTWVVSKEESLDLVSGRKQTSEYRYHHGYWDGVEREFRGFGMVEQRDTESFEEYNSQGLHGDEEFSAVTDPEQFSPPTLQKTWFHLGPVGPEHGAWREIEYGDEYWDEDPSQLSRTDQTRRLLERLDRREQRDAVRAIAGTKLRSELYALDGSARQDRPYRVTERQYGIRHEDAARRGRRSDQSVFFPHPTAARTTDWERGTDPMTRFNFVSDYDEYGQPRTNISVACPQGWRHDRPSPTSDYQASYSTKRYTYEEDERYMVDRVVENRSYLVVDDVDRTVSELRSAIESAAASTRLTGLTYHYYDGTAFEGEELGIVGEYGARVRTEELVVTDELLERAYPDAGDRTDAGASFPNAADPPDSTGIPSYLESDSPSWSEEYPQAFRESVAQRAGYVTRDISDEADISGATTGYFTVTKQVEFDFQTEELSTRRGLARRRRDPLGRESTILEYDPYDLNPLRTESPSGLRTEAEFDYSAMTYWRVTGPNGNRSQTTFSPLGRVTAKIELGDPDEKEGDTPEQPSVQYEYHYHAFSEGSDDQVTPAYVHTTKRKRHRWDLVEKKNEERADRGKPPLSDAEVEALFENEREDHPERFVQRRTYVDGGGTEIQTRGQAESEVFTDSNGDTVLPTDISESPGSTIVGESRVGEEPRVRVSEWNTYDNKGNVVESFEPFYDTGWAFTSRRETERDHPEAFERKVTVHYDALGRRVRSLGPGGAESRVVRGDPSPDLSDPDSFEPTPWVQYQYGAVDNAGRTHGDGARSYDHRWNTPTSTHVDLGERKKVTVTRNRQPGQTATDDVEERRTEVQYDPRDNTTTATDELGREVLTSIADLAGNALRTESVDAGTSWQCYDAAGSVLEARDAKGALRLQVVDDGGRPTRTWARDRTGESVSLRQRIVYGEDAPVSRETAKNRNLLGAVHKGYDESGLVTVDSYDFTGKPDAVTQELLGDDTVVGGPIDWRPGATETWNDRERALLSGREYEMSFEHDALGRLQVQRYPDDVRGRAMELHMEYTSSGSLDGAELVVNPGGSDEKRERYLEAVGRDGKERPVVTAYGNGVLVRSAYDDENERLQRERVENYTGNGASGTTRLSTTGTVHRDIAYDYDVGGNVLEMREEAPGVGVAGSPQPSFHGKAARGRNTMVRSFEYDAIGQLRRATGRECTSIDQPRKWGDETACGFDDFEGAPSVGRSNAPDQTATYTEEYDYDPAGNLRSLRHTRHTSAGPDSWTRHFGYAGNAPKDWDPAPGAGPSGPNRLTHVGDENPAVSSSTHTYDRNGNLVTERNSRYEWDYADRLTSYREVKGGTVSVDASYAYSAGGQRAKKVVDKGDHRREVIEYVGGLVEYHRLETDRTASDGGTVTENNAVRIAGIARKRVGTPFDDDVSFEKSDRPAVEYQYGDRIGCASLSTDGDGNWTNREEFTPFGETTFGGYDRKRYRYQGTERDEESDLYYQGARYYAPWLCRWTTTDPAGPQDGLNLYEYVQNDPVNRSDPTGTESETEEQNENVRYCVKEYYSDVILASEEYQDLPSCEEVTSNGSSESSSSENTSGKNSTRTTDSRSRDRSDRSSKSNGGNDVTFKEYMKFIDSLGPPEDGSTANVGASESSSGKSDTKTTSSSSKSKGSSKSSSGSSQGTSEPPSKNSDKSRKSSSDKSSVPKKSSSSGSGGSSKSSASSSGSAGGNGGDIVLRIAMKAVFSFLTAAAVTGDNAAGTKTARPDRTRPNEEYHRLPPDNGGGDDGPKGLLPPGEKENQPLLPPSDKEKANRKAKENARKMRKHGNMESHKEPDQPDRKPRRRPDPGGSGSSRGGGSSVGRGLADGVGKALDVLDIMLKIRRVKRAPEHKKGEVATEASAGFVGGLAGAHIGYAVGTVGVILGAAVLGVTPAGWVVAAGGIVGALAGGYIGDEMGQGAADAAYGLL